VIVDAMNVIGSRPDGWWRDRRGAMVRLAASLRALEEEVCVVFDGRPWPGAPRDGDGLTVRWAPVADDEIARLVARIRPGLGAGGHERRRPCRAGARRGRDGRAGGRVPPATGRAARVYDLSFLPAGDARRSGDAIALRFTRPDTGALAHVLIDAGYPGDGRRLVVDHVRREWGIERVDLAILTHPDPDHVGGMEEVLSALDVGTLWAHRPALTAIVGRGRRNGPSTWCPWPSATARRSSSRGPAAPSSVARCGCSAPTSPSTRS
jgi:hypothetical protein